MNKSPIRVLVVDDYEPWRLYLSTRLRNELDLQVIGEASDGPEAVRKAEELQPDLILLDIGLPSLNGIEAAGRIREVSPASKILFVSQNRDRDIVGAAMATGALGYVVKSDAAKELLSVLRALRWSLALNRPHLVRDRQSTVYEEIVDAAVALMSSDFASVQMLFSDRGTAGELRLLASRGFNPEAARFWEWVRADSKSTCGIALRDMRRVVAPDIANSEFMANSEDQQVYLETGIRACQTTPLIARSGDLVGMMSTHWRTPHLPSEEDFRLFDMLAIETADLVESYKREEEP